MGDIEAFHAHGLMRKLQIAAKLLYRTHCLRIRLLKPCCLICQIFLSIAGCHLHDVPLCTTLRTNNRNPCPLALGQPALQQAGLGKLLRQKDFARNKGCLMIILLEKGTQQRLIRLLITAGKHKMLPPHHLARTDEKYLHTDAKLGACKPYGILIT